jgi:DNA primase
VDDDTLALFNKDEMQEQAMVRSLLEFGLKQWNDTQKVVDHIFSQIEENELDKMIDNKELVQIIELYKIWYDEGLQPTAKNFLYHEDNRINQLVIKIMDVNVEISPNWKDHYEGHISTREDLFREEVSSTMNYLKLRKIKRLIEENQKELEKAITPEEQLLFLQTHQHLKQTEIELTKEAGTVIFK